MITLHNHHSVSGQQAEAQGVGKGPPSRTSTDNGSHAQPAMQPGHAHGKTNAALSDAVNAPASDRVTLVSANSNVQRGQAVAQPSFLIKHNAVHVMADGRLAVERRTLSSPSIFERTPQQLTQLDAAFASTAEQGFPRGGPLDNAQVCPSVCLPLIACCC